MQTCNHDHVTFRPHADVDDDGSKKKHDQTASHVFEPEDLRHDNIADHHEPKHFCVRTEHAVQRHELFEAIAAVPRHEELHDVAISHDQARCEHYASHVREMPFGDEIFQSVKFSHR